MSKILLLFILILPILGCQTSGVQSTSSVELVPEAMNSELEFKLKENAKLVVSSMSKLVDFEFDYSERSVKWLDGFINRNQDLTLVDTLGSYLGEALLRKYGGTWVIIEGGPALEIRPDFIMFPFSKVEKQIVYGEQESITEYFLMTEVMLKRYEHRG
ncbi:hypothetical protein [Pseudoalteromonas sp. McH1-42]|uniref:hypothetical protein n=1 Tax=Pseudoalteromonas sp. McH1-42 TaxID=2917752 RepID=UPI001EF74A78|nr:hypothetical protein [Pseudoalteromonas sp. McH1-42]MCG7561478.1 hypothetical protein [Pseudoalteromonas sp. McH1-42]